MSRRHTSPTLPSRRGDPPWELARQYPTQGDWTEDEYLALADRILVEFNDGTLEFLPMPTESQQRIVLFLLRALLAFVEPRSLGVALMAPMRVRVRPGKFREPDVIFMLAANAARRNERFWDGADLVMEVVSRDDPERDLVLKRADYAAAGIPEYWIIHPQARTVTVLVLEAGAYRELGVHRPGERAESRLMTGFVVDVREVLTAGTA
jgi:Uma2 family endonuclease